MINPSTLYGIGSFPNLVLPTSLSSHYSGNLRDFFLFPQHAKFINTPTFFAFVYLFFFCMEHFFLDCIKIVSLLAFKSHLKCHLLRKAFPYQLFKSILTSPQAQCVTLAYLTILTEFITVMKKFICLFLQSK